MTSDFIKNITEKSAEAVREFSQAADLDSLEKLRINYLGTKGFFADLMKGLKNLSAEEKPAAGSAANQAKLAAEKAFKAAKEKLLQTKAQADYLDVTLPGRQKMAGHRHLISRTMSEICAVFAKLGFSIEEGPEVETDYYNFEALNFPADHPARDMQDTLFVGHDLLLRTHTSPVQVRSMEKYKPPVWVVAPGKTYRRDSDITHSPMFHQVEGLVVDKGITFADLKGVLTAFATALFSADTKVRLRPSFFPFTEPSAEVDIACVICGGHGCRVCKGTGWLEILGSGMVDPALYGFVGYDPNEVSGFAFGMGVERVAMLKYGLGDIRHLYESDLRFLRQF